MSKVIYYPNTGQCELQFPLIHVIVSESEAVELAEEILTKCPKTFNKGLMSVLKALQNGEENAALQPPLGNDIP